MVPVDGVKIGAFIVIEVRLAAADPIILAASGIGFVDDATYEGTLALPGNQG